MMRTWAGIGLLAAYWLFALGLYRPVNLFFATACLLLAVLLLRCDDLRLPSTARCWAALLLLLPTVWFLPSPYRAAPLIVALGLVLAPIPRRWTRAIGRGAVICGGVLAAQSVAIWAYVGLTARSHDLPGFLTSFLAAVVRISGADVATIIAPGGSSLSLRAAGGVHRLAATWDLLFDPATLCFLVGGWVVLALITHRDKQQTEQPQSLTRAWLRSAAILTAVALAWLPLRAALLITLYAARAERADVAWPLTVMDQFLSPWPSLLLLVVPVLLAVRFVSIPKTSTSFVDSQSTAIPQTTNSRAASNRRYAIALFFAAAAVAILCAIWTWDPVGSPKPGRVMVVEKHSLWEPTDAAYDKISYGEPASYTYSLIYDYCSHFFKMSRLMESDKIDNRQLADCDVLILKTPTSRFSPDEVEAIRRFVRRGGGLLLIGDHTNVFNSSTYLNDVVRQFGFTFANDLLFRVGTPYQQLFRSALVPHPAVCHLDNMDFAVSCSIDPGTSCGRAAIQSTGLWSLPPEYHYPNFHPPSEYRPEMRYGSFIQLWTTRYGRGRVAAFSDSTIFSNFCIFQPGKAELFLGMVDWLNHQSPFDNRWNRLAVALPLSLLAVVMLLAAVWLVRHERAAWLGLLASGMFGLVVASVAVASFHRHAMPWPLPQSPLPMMTIDREISHVSLSKGAFGYGPGERFGLLEQWIPRLGFFTRRGQGPDIASDQGLVIICPTGSVSPEYRRRLEEYVQRGGHLVLFDSPTNHASTANSLLWPFGLSLQTNAAPLAGQLVLPFVPTDDPQPQATGNAAATEAASSKTKSSTAPESAASSADTPWPGEQIEAAWPVNGGRPLAMIDDVAVAAQSVFGRGTVTVVAFASAFNDQNMGGHWMQPPDEDLLAHYNLLYALLESAVKGERITSPHSSKHPRDTKYSATP